VTGAPVFSVVSGLPNFTFITVVVVAAAGGGGGVGRPLDVYINMNINDISSISEMRMVSRCLQTAGSTSY